MGELYLCYTTFKRFKQGKGINLNTLYNSIFQYFNILYIIYILLHCCNNSIVFLEQLSKTLTFSKQGTIQCFKKLHEADFKRKLV